MVSAVIPSCSQESVQEPQAGSSTGTNIEQEQGKKEKKKHEKKKPSGAGSFVIAPLPMVSPAIGAGVVPVAGYITPIPTSEKVPSVIGAGESLQTMARAHSFWEGICF